MKQAGLTETRQWQHVDESRRWMGVGEGKSGCLTFKAGTRNVWPVWEFMHKRGVLCDSISRNLSYRKT